MAWLPPVRVVQATAQARTWLGGVVRGMVPPEVGLLELVSGFMATHAIYAAAKLGIADQLADGPLSADDIAAATHVDPDAAYRLLRACAALGVFAERPDGRFGLTPMADRLRSGAGGSIRPVILMLGHPDYQRSWAQLVHTVETGTPGAEAVLGSPLWDYLDEHPDFAAAFHDAMSRLTDLDWPAVRAAYDLTRFATIVDLGGGNGQLLALALGAAPTATGVLLERAGLIDGAEENLRRAGVLGRCRIEAGSLFETAPSDGDVYLMRRVIHDFDDERAVAILRTVRRQMPPHATLLLLECVVPPGNAPHFAKALDLDMMIFVGGRERTERQFAALLDRAGFRMIRVIPTLSTISVVEAVPGALTNGAQS